ncbi:MAG: hypothetical protein WCF03_19600 [Nitrososphaeraceae archaeon]
MNSEQKKEPVPVYCCFCNTGNTVYLRIDEEDFPFKCNNCGEEQRGKRGFRIGIKN